MASRHATLAFAILLVASGCRTAGVGNLAREDPALPQAIPSAAEVIREHNRLAERVESFEAHPSITVTSPDFNGVVQGAMAMERPRNFSLVLTAGPTRIKVADIGSNDDEFWFWVKDRSRTKEYYFCEYDETGKSPLATTLQPELIVEALGLRVIPEAEAAGCTIQPGPTPDTLALTYKPLRTQGEVFTRMTIFSESPKRILEHRVYSGEGPAKIPLAKAVVKAYQKVALPSEAGDIGGEVYLPSSIRLDWFQEKLSLDVTIAPTMSSPTKVNTVFTQARRDALFVEPKPKGYTRVNLADRAGIADAKGSTSIRESRTAPPTGVQLLEPSTIGGDRTTSAPYEPVPLAADLSRTNIEPEPVVRARVPQAPDPNFISAGPTTATTGWGRRRSIGRE